MGGRQYRPERGDVFEELMLLCSGRCRPLGSPRSFLSHASQLSGAKAVPLFAFRSDRCLILAFSAPRPPGPSPRGAADQSFRSPPSHLESRTRCWPRRFLFTETAGDTLILYLPNRRPWGSPETRGFPDYPANNTSRHSGQAIFLVCVCVGWGEVAGGAPCSKIPQIFPL